MSAPALTIVAERINFSRKSIARAIDDRDEPFIQQEARMQFEAGAETLKAFSEIKARLPGVHILCGVENVSFQLPDRTLLDRTFLPLAMASGVDTAIIDPCNNDIMASIAAAEALLGGDEYCMRYISSRRMADPGKPK